MAKERPTEPETRKTAGHSASTGPASSPDSASSPDPTLFPIVGLGASAGGFEALETFFSNMPATNELAFVVVSHLDPTSKSLMAELLAKRTDMAVTQARDGVTVEPGQVYIAPPGAELTILQGRLKLANNTPPHRPILPVDRFLRSLAEDRGEDAICIILSGTLCAGSRRDSLSRAFRNLNIMRMARWGLRLRLRAAIHLANKQRRKVVETGVRVKANNKIQTIDLVVQPINEDASSNFLLITFNGIGLHAPTISSTDDPTTTSSEDPVLLHLENELRNTQDYLQASVEELETVNEELKSSNEELLSMNEELQSTNEELETAKEESQSVNEELETVNAELNRKVEELDRLNNDMANLLGSLQTATEPAGVSTPVYLTDRILTSDPRTLRGGGQTVDRGWAVRLGGSSARACQADRSHQSFPDHAFGPRLPSSR